MTKKYDKEFKVQTVRLIQEDGKPVAQVSREMDVPAKTLYRWVAEFRGSSGSEAFPGSGNLKPDDKALRDSQKRIRDLEEENEILKKAMHYFAKDRR
jgi:transposase